MITKKALENHDSIFEGVKYAPAGETRPMGRLIQSMSRRF